MKPAAPTEQIREAVRVLAYAVVRHGEAYAPILARLDQELSARNLRESATDYARNLLLNPPESQNDRVA